MHQNHQNKNDIIAVNLIDSQTSVVSFELVKTMSTANCLSPGFTYTCYVLNWQQLTSANMAGLFFHF